MKVIKTRNPSRYMYVLYKLKYTYISLNTNESIIKIYMKGKKTQKGLYMYILSFDKNRHIHEAKHINMKNMYNMGIQAKCMNHQN